MVVERGESGVDEGETEERVVDRRGCCGEIGRTVRISEGTAEGERWSMNANEGSIRTQEKVSCFHFRGLSLG